MTVQVAKQRCHGLLAEAALSAQRHHMRWALLYLYKRGLVWEPLGEPPWYSSATASSYCKVGKQIDFRELVYLMNGTLLRVALTGDPMHHRKDILARSH